MGSSVATERPERSMERQLEFAIHGEFLAALNSPLVRPVLTASRLQLRRLHAQRRAFGQDGRQAMSVLQSFLGRYGDVGFCGGPANS